MRNIIFFVLILTGSLLGAQNRVMNDVIIHVGNGTVIEHGTIALSGDQIIYAGALTDAYNSGYTEIENVKGKHVYPGIISMNSSLGLKEIELARATIDVSEIGTYNPNIRSVIAYNTDSKVIPTLRSNGVLLAQITPDGGTLSGQSSVVKLSGWNWEDAVVNTDIAMHLHWPSAYRYDYAQGRLALDAAYTDYVADLRNFFLQAKAYCSIKEHNPKNLRFESMRRLFTGEQKLFVQAEFAKEIYGAVNLAKELQIEMVLVSGTEVYHVMDLLKENNIPVVLQSTFMLPTLEGDDVDMPYKLPYILQKNRILFGIGMSNNGFAYWNARNLSFAAGVGAGHGLTKEQALSAITLSNAKILGIDDRYGSIEKGKSATLFVAEGDVLDMQTSRVIYILINGEQIPVDNWQTDLYKKYADKYGIEMK